MFFIPIKSAELPDPWLPHCLGARNQHDHKDKHTTCTMCTCMPRLSTCPNVESIVTIVSDWPKSSRCLQLRTCRCPTRVDMATTLTPHLLGEQLVSQLAGCVGLYWHRPQHSQ